MKRLFSLSAMVLAAVSCSCLWGPAPAGQVNPDSKREWKLVWHDEFDYGNRDQLFKVWESANGPTSHTLSSRWPENVETGGGTVRLVNHKENRGGQEWTSGSLTSRKDFLYGYFECRYRYAAATGTNNSFWIASRNTSQMPERGRPFEIDINEGHYPSEYTNNLHDWTPSNHSSNGVAEKYPEIDFSKEFHTFGLEWNEEELVYYMDRKEFRRIRNEFCLTPAPILLSEAVLAWGGAVTDAIDGTYMEVDYVRVYSRRR